ncbi:MAG: hypothetical protein ACTSRO_02010, partial [Candidatus Heimdallarchaeaceae archaeon]
MSKSFQPRKTLHAVLLFCLISSLVLSLTITPSRAVSLVCGYSNGNILCCNKKESLASPSPSHNDFQYEGTSLYTPINKTEGVGVHCSTEDIITVYDYQ